MIWGAHPYFWKHSCTVLYITILLGVSCPKKSSLNLIGFELKLAAKGVSVSPVWSSCKLKRCVRKFGTFRFRGGILNRTRKDECHSPYKCFSYLFMGSERNKKRLNWVFFEWKFRGNLLCSVEHCVKAGKFTWEGLRAKGLIFEELTAITGQHIQVHGTKILYGDKICRICLSSKFELSLFQNGAIFCTKQESSGFQV